MGFGVQQRARGLGLLCASLALVGVAMLAMGGSSSEVSLLSRGRYYQSLSYSDRGMTYAEKEAVRKSKQLQHRVLEDRKEEQTLVDKFMGALKSGMSQAEAEWDYSLRPTLNNRILPSMGLEGRGVGLRKMGVKGQQLAVVMTECVNCVQTCPAYVHHPFKADTFDDFQRLAMSECGMCFSGVSGPCPANKDNHGVV
mmetsp:Transcript_5062/g.11679  ORF Transcript_5062/g.11679 Transcript_5062/m.11679 type:complete len:197 (-) Transcript_5062:186-776(-)